MRLREAVFISLLMIAACRAEPEGIVPVAPPPALTQAPRAPAPVILPEKVSATRAGLITFAEAGSLRGLGEVAAQHEDFVSNFGGQDHVNFWNLMRRTGVDPNLKLRQLFELKPGLREVDGQRWYVWPDLAAREPADLIPEKLSFDDRRRLEGLIGEEGIARIRAGEGYPGMRTAISDDGTWIHFVLGQDGED